MRPELTRTLALALASTALLGAAACGGEKVPVDVAPGAAAASGAATTGTTPTTPASPTKPAPPTTPPTSATRPTAPGGRMTEGLSATIVLQRNGGMIGAKDRLELRPDGTYTVTSKNRPPVTRQLNERAQADVVTALRTANLSRMRPGPTAGGATIVDGFSYTLIVGKDSVTLGEPIPKQVVPLLAALGALFSAPSPTP
jgi:hypothetical protein